MQALYTPTRLISLSMIGALSLASGCGNSESAANSGTLSLRVTDAVVDSAEHVYVEFGGLEIQAPDGSRITVFYCQDPADATKTVVSSTPCTTTPAPKQLDLLALTGGEAAYLLDHVTLPAGRYPWIRLMVNTAGTRDTYIVTTGGGEYELDIPSGAQTGLKLVRGFGVPAGGSADFTIDFDLRKSVRMTGTADYSLRPTLRMADNAVAGAIAGSVDSALVPGGCTPAVYIFAGAGATPDDIDGTPSEPITTAAVRLDATDGTYRYKAAFLEAGSYTVAYTCQAALDDPAADDALTFSGTSTVTVEARRVAVHDFF